MQSKTELEKLLDLVERLPFEYSDKAAFYRVYDILPDNYVILLPPFVKIMSSLILLAEKEKDFGFENTERKDRYKL